MIIEISVAVIALAFLALAIFVIITLISANRSIKKTEVLLQQMEGKINTLTRESIKIMETGNEIAVNLQDKIIKLDPLFKSVEDIGSSIEVATSSFKQLTNTVSDTLIEKGERRIERNGDRIVDIAEWALLGLSIFQKFKSRR